jgi:pyruvate/2-oxoglutarate/acetoin dehydrogenase E1 component
MIREEEATVPATHPSVQTCFVLEVMDEKDRSNQKNWNHVFPSLEMITSRLSVVEQAYQHLSTQVELVAGVAEQAVMERTEMIQKIEEMGK